MTRKRLLALLLAVISHPILAAQVELMINGQQQTVQFDLNNKKDLERAKDLWRQSEKRTFYIYSDIGGFLVCDRPQEDNSCKRVGNWSKGLSTRTPTNPELANIQFDKKKWWPWNFGVPTQWIKMDDPHIVWPKQMQPITHWPIRYMMHYVPDETVEEPVKYKYDNYTRYQFDQEGFLLNNRTMKRYEEHTEGKIFWYRIFGYKDLVTLDVVTPDNPEKSIFGMAGNDLYLSFQLSEQLKESKVAYIDPGQDIPGDEIYAWAGFDDPVQPLYDKKHGNMCVMDCKNRKRWAPSPFDARY